MHCFLRKKWTFNTGELPKHILEKHFVLALNLVLVEKIKKRFNSLVKTRLKTNFNKIFEPDVAVALILAHFVKKEGYIDTVIQHFSAPFLAVTLTPSSVETANP
jgi:hypothetical protein